MSSSRKPRKSTPLQTVPEVPTAVPAATPTTPIIIQLRPRATADEPVAFDSAETNFETAPVEQPNNDELSVDQIREILSNHKQQPSQTCFWDRHAFLGKSTPLLLNWNGNEYESFGYFCSPECALAYLDNEANLTNNEKWASWTAMRLEYGAVIPAGHWLTLKAYGGPLNITQFRLIQSNQKAHQLLTTNLPLKYVYQDHAIRNVIEFTNPSFIPVNAERVEKATKQLKLARSKPVQRGTGRLKIETIAK